MLSIPLRIASQCKEWLQQGRRDTVFRQAQSGLRMSVPSGRRFPRIGLGNGEFRDLDPELGHEGKLAIERCDAV